MTIGERIKERREALGMTQQELADRLGYKSRSTINKIEMNGRNLKQSKIKAFADVLQTTPGYIMGWDNKEDYIIYDSISHKGLIKKITLMDYLEKASEPNVDRLYDYMKFLIMQEKEGDKK